MIKMWNKMYYQGNELDENKQDCFINNLKFFLIVCVVIGHFIAKINWMEKIRYLYYFIHLFHMPCFIFVSGYLSKRMNIGGKLKAERIFSMFWLYLVFKFGDALLITWLDKKPFEMTVFNDIPAPWYLLSMTYWYLMIPFIERVKPKIMIILAFLSGILIGFVNLAGSSFSISRTVVFFPFFVIGFYLSEDRLQKLLNLKIKWLAFLLLSASGLFFIYQGKSVLSMLQIVFGSTSYQGVFGNKAYGMTIRIIWYFAALFFSICIMLLIPRCKLFFSSLGTRTLQIYILHIWIRKILISLGFFTILQQFPGIFSWMVIPGCILLTFLLSGKRIKYIFDFISGIKFFKKLLVKF